MCFPVKFAIFLRTPFLQNTFGDSFQKYLMNSLSLPLQHLGTKNGVISWYVLVLQRLFHFMTCVLFLSNFFFFSSFLWILLHSGFEVSLSILKIKHWSYSQVLKWSFEGELLQLYLVINITSLVQFGKNLSYILPRLASQSYFQQSISVKLIYQFYLINGYFVFRCLEKVFKEERTRIKKEIVKVL